MFGDNNRIILRDTPHNYGYDPNEITVCSAPLYQQAFRWFREKHNLDGIIEHTMNCTKGESKYLTKYSYIILGNMEKSSSTIFKTFEGRIEMFYEEAELNCLRKLISIVKSKSNG